MLKSTLAFRRVNFFNNIQQKSRNIDNNYNHNNYNLFYSSYFVRWKSDDRVVTIGDVSKKIKIGASPEYIPRKYLPQESTQEELKNLKWMLQKDVLGQDIFLVGSPGRKRRSLALSFLELTDRESEYISLSRDTTEADLKQRREIEGGTANYKDQGAVRAAVYGRVLILEGIEKAERNVLPVLNNLLENREMHLEDGRFLIPASRYDKLLKDHSKEELDSWRLVRVSEDFRVVALGLPSSRYQGHPLDPPLRSRFQARHIAQTSFRDQFESLKAIAPDVDAAKLSQILSCCHALVTEDAVNLGLPDFPLENVLAIGKILDNFPSLEPYDAFYRLYPYKLFLGKEGRDAVESILQTFGILDSPNSGSKRSPKAYQITNSKISEDDNSALVSITDKTINNSEFVLNVPSGSNKTIKNSKTQFVDTNYQNNLLAEMTQSHLVSDFCLIGPKGCGKSTTVEKLAETLAYEIEPIVLYQDMTSRDLIQQRTTSSNGDTVWKDSPLVQAAMEGKLAVLDGIHRIHSSTLAVVYRLVHDRELQLHDGKRLIRSDRYEEIKKVHEKTDDDMAESGIFKIHPSFRIIALAEPPTINSAAGQWLNSELLSLFLFHEMRPLGKSEEIHIIEAKYGLCSKPLLDIINLTHDLRSSLDPTLQSLANSLSTRQLLRIANRMRRFADESAYEAVQRACMARFLPAIPKQALEESLSAAGIVPLINKGGNTEGENSAKCEISGNVLTIGNTTIERCETKALTKVPDVLFYDLPQHIKLLEFLLQDFILGENLLIVGNQGVGKNKIVDRLLQLMNKPREYIQLHRDTTVQTLTLQTMVKDGKVVYEDSPLVQAVKLGHVLVVDEADKAPTHVTCILKTLVESGEMILSDGRRIVPPSASIVDEKSANIIKMNPDFRIIVLANRPGFPFLGNDFFGALGDLFSTHSVDNPSFESEIQLLKEYGPDVDHKVIKKLVKAFGELRSMADQGLVSYPYSTREVVNIVKHLQKFPNESLATVVQNVFDFDRYTQEVFDTLISVLHKNGIPLGTSVKNVELAKEISLPGIKFAGNWSIVNDANDSNSKSLPVEERFLKFKAPSFPYERSHVLDRIEARSSWFTELQSYWTVPIGETGTVAALTVSQAANENGSSDDRIHVLTTNPLSLFSTSLESEKIREISIQGLIAAVRGNRPQFTMASDDSGNIVIHEETSNSLLFVNPENGGVRTLQLSSFLESASDSLSRALGSDAPSWKMNPNLLKSDNQLVLFTPNESRLEIIDLKSMTAYSINLPFKIDSIVLSSERKWLIQDITNGKYVLEKSSESSPCPNVLKEIDQSDFDRRTTGRLLGGSREKIGDKILSEVLNEKIESPNRLFATDSTFGSIVVGFPELDNANGVYYWPRKSRVRGFSDPIISENGQIVKTVSCDQVPEDILPGGEKPRGITAYLEIVDVGEQKLRYIPIPEPAKVSPVTQWLYAKNLPVYAALTSDKNLVTIDAGGCIRLWETSLIGIEKSLGEWRKMIGTDGEYLQITKDRYSGLDTNKPIHGKVDPNNKPHVGGNIWAGGTGGRDTAGLGGKGGPYRLDAGHTVHQLSDEEKNAVPEHVKKAAREMGVRAFKQKLKDIRMSEYDHNLYSQFSDAVQKQVKALRVILGSLQAKSNERQWSRHQTSGELDDTKLIEGLTGEKTIYRRRTDREPEVGAPQLKPKRLKLVVDVSGSMYRFNSYDGRLDREMEACVMVMEAFSGYEGKFQYDIIGHSGDDYHIDFVHHSQPPMDNKQRLEVIKTMHAHSQFCISGDHTLEATQHAIASLAKEDSDESIVVLLSDANFERYGIKPERFARILMSNPDINAYAIFIGSLGDQATRLTKKMPSGKAFICMDLKNIPKILQQIFAASVLSTVR